MSALHDLIAKELGRIGIKAQDEVEDHQSWMDISDQLGNGWRALHGRDFERAAEMAASADLIVETVLKEEKRGAGQ